MENSDYEHKSLGIYIEEKEIVGDEESLDAPDYPQQDYWVCLLIHLMSQLQLIFQIPSWHQDSH